jgi:hypothetical protein
MLRLNVLAEVWKMAIEPKHVVTMRAYLRFAGGDV